jgi:hypothetical protein
MIYPEAAKVLSFTPVVALIYAKAFALNVHLIAGYLCGNAWRNRDSVRSSTLKGFVSGIMYLAAVTPLFVVSIQLGGQIKTIEAKMEAWQLTNSFIQDLKKTHPEINTKDFEKRLRDLSFNYVPKFND